MSPSAPVLVEACVDSLESARQSALAGAGRLELCAGLEVGGTTPAPELLAAVRGAVTIPVFVMIRPRGGDFRYDAGEIASMLSAIEEAGRLGADGVVFGALDERLEIDVPVTRRLLEAARPLGVTFHRAFDLTRSPDEALDVLMELGIERVLTSGQAETAEEGIPVLRRMVSRGAGRIAVLAGGSVTETNAAHIVRKSGVREVHLRARTETHPGRIRSVVAAVAG